MMKQRQKLYKDKDSGSSGEETELFVKNPSPKREIPTIEKDIEEGDTLQSLAIRYRCTIEELKRLNNIHKENEIFARRTIKVPYHPISAALKTVPVHISGVSSIHSKPSTSEPVTGKLIDIESPSTSSAPPVPVKKKSEVNDIIFNSNISQKLPERLYEDISTEVTEEEIHLLPNRLQIPEADPIISKIDCSGADCDISWIALIGCIVIVIFAVPLIYVFYVAEHLEKYHHHHNSS